jgi:thiol-disulfide isomerase/thioredoxin
MLTIPLLSLTIQTNTTRLRPNTYPGTQPFRGFFCPHAINENYFFLNPTIEENNVLTCIGKPCNMKTTKRMIALSRGVIILMILCIQAVALQAQKSDTIVKKLPDVAVVTLDNRSISTSTLSNNGKPMILIFWKSCCDPNIKMLDEISQVYTDWQEETGVVIYAISTDDSRSAAGIAPLANGKGWEFVILLDINSDFKRAMNVNITPHIFILNDKKEVIWQKTSYNPGDENEIYKILLTLKK